jgi:hypothetical protein
MKEGEHKMSGIKSFIADIEDTIFDALSAGIVDTDGIYRFVRDAGVICSRNDVVNVLEMNGDPEDFAECRF